MRADTQRREFLKESLVALGSFPLPMWLRGRLSALGGERTASPEKKVNIGYARQEIPVFDIPPYSGELYEDTVPDTLDLAERAKLALRAATSITDPDAEYEIYMWVDFFRNPPVMRHDFSDLALVAEGIMEGMPLLRLVTGSDLNSNIDQAWMNSLLKSIGPDGLYYMPLGGRPWGRLN